MPSECNWERFWKIFNYQYKWKNKEKCCCNCSVKFITHCPKMKEKKELHFWQRKLTMCSNQIQKWSNFINLLKINFKDSITFFATTIFCRSLRFLWEIKFNYLKKMPQWFSIDIKIKARELKKSLKTVKMQKSAWKQIYFWFMVWEQ